MVTSTINVRGAALTETIGAKIDDIDRALGSRSIEVALTLSPSMQALASISAARRDSF